MRGTLCVWMVFGVSSSSLWLLVTCCASVGFSTSRWHITRVLAAATSSLTFFSVCWVRAFCDTIESNVTWQTFCCYWFTSVRHITHVLVTVTETLASVSVCRIRTSSSTIYPSVSRHTRFAGIFPVIPKIAWATTCNCHFWLRCIRRIIWCCIL